ncbi:MAG TPA: hypothetical protein VIJ34_08160 [Acidimicrobiales bacterium]
MSTYPLRLPATFRSRRRAFVVLVALGAMVFTALPSSVWASQTRLSGFGDTMHQWARSFPADTNGCAAPNCYGPAVRNSTANFEFTYITTAKGRVDGFDVALRRGTPFVRAELRVAELFPGDIQMSSLDIIHRDLFGNACAVYNLSSKTIAHVFGDKAFGDSHGTVGVELATVLPSGETAYEPGNVDLVLVVPSYLGSNADC